MERKIKQQVRGFRTQDGAGVNGILLNKLQTLQADDIGGSCSIVDAKWKCD